MSKRSQKPIILILEDDQDQMDLLTALTLGEAQKLINDTSIDDSRKQDIRNVNIVSVGDINSLKKAVLTYKKVLLAILDCNVPDTKHTAAHDQLIKTNHRITGQHRAVDLVLKNLPETPIAITSSWDRFRIIVGRYYQRKYNLTIKFVRKSDMNGFKKYIEIRLRALR